MYLSSLKRSVVAISAATLTHISAATADTNNDPYLWLEAVDSVESLEWVNEQNKNTANTLNGPLYDALYVDALEVLSQEEKLSSAYQIGDYFFELKKTTDNPRGVLQRATSESFLSGEPAWSVVIDIDALSAEEDIAWVYHGLNCYQDNPGQCLIALSPGGTDADEIREFNALTGEFAVDGFFLPLAKSGVTWIDENSWLVATEYGEDSLTDSGYARQVRLLERGSNLEDSKIIYSASKRSVSAGSWTVTDGDETSIIIQEGTSFWTRDYYLFNTEINSLSRLEIPNSATLMGKLGGQWIISVKQDWEFGEQFFSAGTVVLASDLSLELQQGATALLTPTETEIIEDVNVTEAGILAITLDNVVSKAYWLTHKDNTWTQTTIKAPRDGALVVQSVNGSTGEALLRYESFLVPPSLLAFNPESMEVSTVQAQPATFDSSPYVADQYFATSADGTKVPYFIVHSKTMRNDGKNPTHIFAYGGFRSSLTPSYSGSYEATNGSYGKLWLDRGGVYVLANIRGGGEYGPNWHSAALRENRVKAFEDMEAVAMDLAERGISSAEYTSIEGRSNGGLLTGSTMVRHPELYNAVISGVPLLDMQRYHLMLAGASWMGEYGNPDTADWDFIKDYSPYQNVSENVEYPPVFFYTSTRDDRVHPAHARKMAARMMEQGHHVEYYENLEGGHGGSVTHEQLAHRIALSYAFLWSQIPQ